MTDLKDKQNATLAPTNLGKRFIFLKVGQPNNAVFKFSSKLEDIGTFWDRQLKNNTEVVAISDSITITHPSRGMMPVIQIMSEQSMWILSEDLFPVEEKYW